MTTDTASSKQPTTKRKSRSSQAWMNRLDDSGTIAFAVGWFAIFQSGYEWLYYAGLVALSLGTLLRLGVPLLRGERWQSWMEQVTVLGMFVGILGMLQAWDIWLYENGFYILGLATVGFIIVLHLPASDAESRISAGPTATSN